MRIKWVISREAHIWHMVNAQEKLAVIWNLGLSSAVPDGEWMNKGPLPLMLGSQFRQSRSTVAKGEHL